MQPAAALSGYVGVEVRAYYTPLVFDVVRPEITTRVRSNGFIEGNSAVNFRVNFSEGIEVVDKLSCTDDINITNNLRSAILADNNRLLPGFYFHVIG